MPHFALAATVWGGISCPAPDMSTSETPNHRRLKALALAWAQANGFGLAGVEVRVPKSGYRADVAAYARGVGARGARTAVFECKQSRADLLKDAHAEAETRARLAALVERRRGLEEMLAVHRPDLRCGEALWPEFDRWDFARLEHTTYRDVLAEIETVQRRVLRGTKFAKMFRYRCADFLYLVVDDGIFAEAEIPAGWGLLVRTGSLAGVPGAAGEDALRLVRPPVDLRASEAQRQALLEGLAAAGTREANRMFGVGRERPEWAAAREADAGEGRVAGGTPCPSG